MNATHKIARLILLPLIALLATQIPLSAFAHEGHDELPGSIQAPHGGVIQTTPEHYVELVTSASGVKIYLMTHEMKPVLPSDVTVQATMQLPKKKKEPAPIAAAGEAFEIKANSRGAHRYQLNLEITPKKNPRAKKESVTFQVEPQH